MDKYLFNMAAKLIKKAYGGHVIDLGTTEFFIFRREWNGQIIQILVVPGTNEWRDWWVNFDLRSREGIKKGGVDAAEEIHKYLKDNSHLISQEMPLYVVVHSKSGPTGIAYKKKYGCDGLVMFAPARSMKYDADRVLDNTVLFHDGADPVTELLGRFSFGHPICKKYKSTKNGGIPFRIKGHLVDYWIDFTAGMSC